MIQAGQLHALAELAGRARLGCPTITDQTIVLTLLLNHPKFAHCHCIPKTSMQLRQPSWDALHETCVNLLLYQGLDLRRIIFSRRVILQAHSQIEL